MAAWTGAMVRPTVPHEALSISDAALRLNVGSDQVHLAPPR
jgi:hypothetical protein